MSRRTTGVIFICVSAFLYGIKYLSAAIFSSNITTWSSDLFHEMLTYVGNGPVIGSWFALVAGLGYLIASEFENQIKTGMKKIKENLSEIERERNAYTDTSDKQE